MSEALGARWLSLRTRMVLLAVLLVTLVLVVAGILLGVALRSILLDELRVTTELRSQAWADLAARDALPHPVPVDDPDEVLVQVVSGAGVLTSSANIEGVPPLDVARPGLGETILGTVDRLPLEEADGPPFVVAATTVEAADGPVTVIVAVSSEEVGETVGRAASLGLRGLPALVVALAVAIWVVVSRTLAPIEGIRAQAEAITGSELHRRVPEPPRNDEVGRLARTLNAMLGRLERSVERQRGFVADAAHELRSPITSARTQLETARTLRTDVDWSSVSADVLEDILRMQVLTEELLLLARIDAGEMRLRREPVDVDDMVDVMTAPERAAGARRRVDISGVEPVQALVDRVLVERVLRNLLDNAYRHARTCVAVGVRRDNSLVRLTVEDDGAGIPESARDAVFERFQRLDEARDRDRGGAGLGLAIAADIARAHGGSAHADASPLGGARITVTLPIGDV